MNTLSNETTDTQKSDEAGAPHGHHHYQDNVTALMSPWFKASEYRPMMVGPYECEMTGAFSNGDGKTHMRWWDGELWSYPLQPEHETVDGEWMKPADTYFIRQEIEIYNARFSWRGFNEDQEPL